MRRGSQFACNVIGRILYEGRKAKLAQGREKCHEEMGWGIVVGWLCRQVRFGVGVHSAAVHLRLAGRSRRRARESKMRPAQGGQVWDNDNIITLEL